MFAAEARGELSKGKALEWAHETKNIKKLPERKKTADDIAKELIDRIDICAVDGGQARQQDQSFSVGGHHYVYPFIPENEVWIEKGNHGKDLSTLIGHEVTERDMMKRQGLTYDQAHPIANHVEEAVRLEEGKQDGDTESNNKEAAQKPYRNRAELFAIDAKGRILGGFYPNNDFGTFGGGVDKGENKARAAAREFKEESGYKVTNVRPAGVKPHVQDWSAIKKTDDPLLTAKQEERSKQFKGAITNFFIGDIVGPKGTRDSADASHTFKAVKFRPLSSVIKKQESAIARVADKDGFLVPGMPEKRLDVLRELEKLKMPKTAADNENSSRSILVKFFNKNHNPDDESFHAFAESKGLNKHKLEAEAYALATGYARFLGDGRAREKSVTESDVDSGELSRGTEVETEHTSDRTTAKRIALDHLAEIPDYYTRLKKMEDAATSSEKKTASDIVALVAQRVYAQEKRALSSEGTTRAIRYVGDLGEEGLDQYLRYKIRKKREDEYARQEQHQSLPKVAAGANFPPISGPTATSGITTASQEENKLPRCPPVPKPESQPLGSWDIDKVSSIIDALIPKVAVAPGPVEDPQALYERAVGVDRRHRILKNSISGALAAGISSPIMFKQMGMTTPNALKMMLFAGGVSGLMGGAMGGVSGLLTSKKDMRKLYEKEGPEGLQQFIQRRDVPGSVVSGVTGGLVGAGTSLLLRDRFRPAFQGSESAVLRGAGMAVPPVAELAGSIAPALGASYLTDKFIDAMHRKQGSYYDSFPHNPEEPEVPADRYTAGRQGLLYLTSALHPLLAAPVAAATAHPEERFDQFGRTLFGGIAGDVVGGLAGSFVGGPKGFMLGSLLGRPAGTYITQHLQ
jgi:hypothetical protein